MPEPRWYHLRLVPAMIALAATALVATLSFVPRTIDHMGPVFPGADFKPVVRAYGFPTYAVFCVSTEQVTATPTAFATRPRGGEIEFLSPGPKLKWTASEKTIAFEDGSDRLVVGQSIALDFAVFVIFSGAAWAICLWWSRKSLAPQQ
jgi:hypothetical protein